MSEQSNPDALVIGAGPAGLMAAEELGRAGARVVLAEAKPSPARKFLMAGKSGLNLTKDESPKAFIAAYPEGRDWLAPMLGAFGPAEVMVWAEGLGQRLFVGSTGRVFPEVMKASPLLRAWLARLDGYGVERQMRWRWAGRDGPEQRLLTPQGERRLIPHVTVLALGGASWARLGSDGSWAGLLAEDGVALAPFQPSNAGLRVNWSPHMVRHFGSPVKNIRLSAGDQHSRGEVVLSMRGIEGGGVYPLSPALRGGARLMLDLMPDVSHADVSQRLTRNRGKSSLKDHLRKALNLGPAQIALLQEFGRPLPGDAEKLAGVIKALPVRHAGFRPMDEAISTAGGVRQDAVDADLMLRAHPSLYVAGEMLDWDAPTGGYLITACMATGRWAGRAAARRLGLDAP